MRPSSASCAAKARLTRPETKQEQKETQGKSLARDMERSRLRYGVDDGARTHDRRNHNPELYQLSYAHHSEGVHLNESVDTLKHEALKPVLLKPEPLKKMVRTERLELSHLTAPEPKSGVSTNFTTSALLVNNNFLITACY